MNKIQGAFSSVKASERLKQETLSYVQEERILRKYRGRNNYLRYAALLTALLLFVGISGHAFLNKAVSYIGVDGIPSLEFALNRLGNVVDVQAYNEDGSSLLKQLSLEGKSYTEALNELFSNPEFCSFLENNPDIAFSVMSKDSASLLSGIQSCDSPARYSGTCSTYDQDLLDKAHACGLSMAKYQAYLDLCQYDDGITTAECRNMSMNDLHTLLSHHAEASHDAENPASSHDADAHDASHDGGEHHTDAHTIETHSTDDHEAEAHHSSSAGTASKLTCTPKPTAVPKPTCTPCPSYNSGSGSSHGSEYCDDSYSYNSGYCDDSYSYDSGYCDDSYSESHHGESHGGSHGGHH